MPTKTDVTRTKRASEVKPCLACGCSHPVDRFHVHPIIQAHELVVQRPGVKIKGLYQYVQEYAQQPIRFGELCEAIRKLPPEVATPGTKKDSHMVICTRVQDGLKDRFKHGPILERFSPRH